MKQRAESLLENVPRMGIIAGIPVAAFLVTVGLTLASGGGSETPRSPTSVPVQVQLAPTSAASPTPQATASGDRTDCAAIAGSDYRSSTEREWFLKNCNGAQALSSVGGGAAGGGPSRYAVETALGDRLVISKIGVDAPVSRAAVSPDGTMPDPTGYFNAVLYDFSAMGGGLGGTPASGNAVLAGHVDCARCGPGGTPGLAVFYYMRNLVPGDVIEYYTQGGGYYKYVVTYVADLPPDADWGSIVASNAADMTLITCSGTFQSAIHEYTTRRVVQARKA